MTSKRFSRRELTMLGGISAVSAMFIPGLIAPAYSAAPKIGKMSGRSLAKPTATQLAFQDMEIGVFIHYSIDTYGSVHADMPATAFNPADLDTEQWVLAAKAMGADYVVLTARHEQGFCLWPTATTDYSIKNSPYKGGKGDIVREFVDACHKHGLKPGLYTPPWIDDHFDRTQLGLDPTHGNGDIDKYDDPVMYGKVQKKEFQQLHELMTGYGPLVFFWADHYGRSDSLGSKSGGGKLRELYADIAKRSHKIQPNCLYFGPDVEHVGNEDGHTTYPLWNAVETLDGTPYTISTTYKWEGDNVGAPWGQYYRPRLGSTTLGFSTGGWMWTGPRVAQPFERQLQVYYEMIGRGSGVIINLTPDKSGRIPSDLVASAQAFGDEIRRRFSNPVGEVKGTGATTLLRFAAPRRIDHLVAMEDLAGGQKIAGYRIEAEINGQWRVVAQGETVGHKRIDRITPVTASAIRFICTNALKTPISLRRFAAYDTAIT